MDQEPQRPQSLGEEIANSVIHGAGCLAALIATPFLLIAAGRHGGGPSVAGAAVFAATAVILYLASTLYHALPRNRAKRVFRVIDHSAIYLLIAGTYTPFTIGILRGVWGWILFAVVWSAALLGIVAKAIGGFRFPRLSTILYVVMGWVALVAIGPLWARMPAAGWMWLIAGGVAYTAGVGFYAADRHLRYGHSLWHACVLAGTSCHFCAVLWYAI